MPSYLVTVSNQDFLNASYLVTPTATWLVHIYLLAVPKLINMVQKSISFSHWLNQGYNFRMGQSLNHQADTVLFAVHVLAALQLCTASHSVGIRI